MYVCRTPLLLLIAHRSEVALVCRMPTDIVAALEANIMYYSYQMLMQQYSILLSLLIVLAPSSSCC